ncbi:7 transmembrane receptor (rhodopsin family) domain-containing protein [Ditylenchus destructor]|uniref:7 transmembrane receptor (Rhodopsin family) domain-containing protein n=1 Tax=Ditylenchus destructor TaxID=166010 RepID=A0AAD4NB30_9BILA|nr:7 transmembrane receptor (rhodopsin family) domain-containing protein [Ditylenchus destructor]
METPAEPGGVALFTTSPTSTIFPLLLAQDIMVQATTSMVFGLSSTTTTVLPALLVDSSETEECVSMNDLLWEYRQDLTTRPLVMTLFAILYIVIIIFGVVGNVCVILAIARTRSLQTVPNMFIFSLSCSDVVVCCTSATITPITAFQKEWLFGRFLCSVAPFIAGVSLCFSTFTLAAISVDRFMLIRFPMKKPFTHGQAFFIICIICVLAMAMSVPVVFMQTLKQIDKYCGQFCFEDWGSSGHSQRRAYGTLMLALQFVIPLGAIVFCYTAISLRLDQQRAATKRRQRTNRMFIAMVVAFSASWIWTLLFNLLRDYEILPQFVKDQEFFFGILTHCIAMTSTVWNPLLYALLNLQLRAAFVQLMPECLKHCVQSHCANSKKSQRANQYRDAGGNGSNDVPLLANDSSRRRSSPANCHATALTNCNNTTYFDRRPSQKASGGQPTNGKLLTTRSKGYEEETTVTMNGYGFHPSVAGCEYDCSPTTPSNQQRLSLSTTTATSALLTEQNGKMSNTSSTSKYGSLDIAKGAGPWAPVVGNQMLAGGDIKAHSNMAYNLAYQPVADISAFPSNRTASQIPQTTAFFNIQQERAANGNRHRALHRQWTVQPNEVGADCGSFIAHPPFTNSDQQPKTVIQELVSSWRTAFEHNQSRHMGRARASSLGQFTEPVPGASLWGCVAKRQSDGNSGECASFFGGRGEQLSTSVIGETVPTDASCNVDESQRRRSSWAKCQSHTINTANKYHRSENESILTNTDAKSNIQHVACSQRRNSSADALFPKSPIHTNQSQMVRRGRPSGSSLRQQLSPLARSTTTAPVLQPSGGGSHGRRHPHTNSTSVDKVTSVDVNSAVSHCSVCDHHATTQCDYFGCECCCGDGPLESSGTDGIIPNECQTECYHSLGWSGPTTPMSPKSPSIYSHSRSDKGRSPSCSRGDVEEYLMKRLSNPPEWSSQENQPSQQYPNSLQPINLTNPFYTPES